MQEILRLRIKKLLSLYDKNFLAENDTQFRTKSEKNNFGIFYLLCCGKYHIFQRFVC